MNDYEKRDAFLQRAGFEYGWENLESIAREMVEQAMKEIKVKDIALQEANKMADAIEKCSLEPDKVYIFAGRIKQAIRQSEQGEQ